MAVPQRRIKILETFYDDRPDRNLVQWLVEDIETGKKTVLCWPGSDLGPAVGVNAALTPEMIKQFCKDVEGKEINMVVHVDMEELNIEAFKEMNEKELQKHHEVVDKYPFYEILKTLEEQKQFQDARKSQAKDSHGKYLSLKDMLGLKNED